MDAKYMSALKHQHERVHSLRAQVVVACDSYLQQPTEEHWHALAGAFRGLAEHLDRHFSFEEHEGFLVDVVARMPESIDRVKKLREDHDSIRMAFMDWGRVIETSADDVKRTEIASAGVDGLLMALDEHEKREAALLQEAYLQDSGR
jgi:hypothetical protein